MSEKVKKIVINSMRDAYAIYMVHRLNDNEAAMEIANGMSPDEMFLVMAALSHVIRAFVDISPNYSDDSVKQLLVKE